MHNAWNEFSMAISNECGRPYSALVSACGPTKAVVLSE